MCGLFVEKGYTVITTPKDGVQVIGKIELEEPDVVIMDTTMINLDALAVLKRCSSDSSLKMPMFIVTSIYDNAFVEKQIMENGAAYYLLKPFELSVLYDIINNTEEADIEAINCRRSVALDCLELRAIDILLQIGTPANIKGYQYIKTSIIECAKNSEMLGAIVKILYPEIAKIHGTTDDRVERAIRHAIKLTYERGNLELLNSIFKNAAATGHKPTNSEFIALLTDKIKLECAYLSNRRLFK